MSGSLTGELRVYLGAAPGVGKTFAMLDEARRRAARGTAVVVAVADTHGRSRTAELLDGLPALAMTASGDVDVDRVLDARPAVAVVDGLARHHGAVERLLDAGITVLTTLDIGEIESLRGAVEEIVATPPAATVPDVFLRGAQVELVDMTPEALRRRLAHGNVVPAEELDARLANRFRSENLAALRDISLRWVADHAAPARDAQVDRASQLVRNLPPTSPRSAVLSARRQLIGWLLAAALLPLLTLLLTLPDQSLELSSTLFAYLAVVVLVASIGGIRPALVTALVASALANWFFTPPVHRWRVEKAEDVVALLVFMAVGTLIGSMVATASRRSTEAARARADAATLARLAATSIADDPVEMLVEQLRGSFALDAVTVRRDGMVVATAGPVPAPERTALRLPLGDEGELLIGGGALAADDRAVLAAYADQLQSALRSRRLREQAATARALSEANELRTALLNAVSHDLRTPLASIKASVSSLLQDDVEWPAEAIREFLATIDAETDRLDGLVGNLLDMSRLQTGTLELRSRAVGLDEVIPAALASLGPVGDEVDVAVPESLPRVRADAGLLERAVANVIANAVRYSPPGRPARIDAAAIGPWVDIRIADRGPGIGPADHERVFLPFQRLRDAGDGGVGLGLAVARGFVDAMGGTITIEDTPGGGLTMVFRLPAVES